jgi:hypothetical protein
MENYGACRHKEQVLQILLPHPMNTVVFADDSILLSEKEGDLQRTTFLRSL